MQLAGAQQMQLKRGAENLPQADGGYLRHIDIRAVRANRWENVMKLTLTRRALGLALSLGLLAAGASQAADKPDAITLDWATYNPVSMLLKDKGWLEEEFAKDGISITWVQSLGSNKALEFLNAGSIDFGSSAGAAALVSKIHGNPIKSIYVYSKPEWTALVTGKDSDIDTVADLKGKSVAVTRGTDPHIFLVRALQGAGLSEQDITPVLLQHPDGATALVRGDVDAWAGLDPMMANLELNEGARLFHRDADANTYGILSTRQEFLEQHPDLVQRLLIVYEAARKYALEHPDELKASFIAATKLPDAVADKQLNERTDLSNGVIGEAQRDSILQAGLALQKAGVIEASVDVDRTLDDLIADGHVPVSN
jgi:sulfonate transport system substrate-binding protein